MCYIYFHLLSFMLKLVGIEGFEPSTPASQTRCANQTALHSECLFISAYNQGHHEYDIPTRVAYNAADFYYQRRNNLRIPDHRNILVHDTDMSHSVPIPIPLLRQLLHLQQLVGHIIVRVGRPHNPKELLLKYLQ